MYKEKAVGHISVNIEGAFKSEVIGLNFAYMKYHVYLVQILHVFKQLLIHFLVILDRT
jgi:hypothetical protein